MPIALQDADRHQVARAHQRLAQPRRAAELAASTFSGRQVSSLPLPSSTIGRIEDDARRGEAVLERRRIDVRLDGQSRLPLGLRGAVELREMV